MSYLEKTIIKSSKKNGDIYDLHYKNSRSNVIKKIILTVDLSLDAIQHAIKEKFSFIISYQGLIVNPITNFSSVLVDKLSLISKFPINIFVLKESYFQTICDTIVDNLFLNNAEVFSMQNGIRQKTPIGLICSPQLYPNQTTESFRLKHLIQRAMNKLQSPYLMYIGELERNVKKIAIVETEYVNISTLNKLNDSNIDCFISGVLGQDESILCKDLKLSVVSLSFYDCVKKALEKLTNILSLEFPREEFYLYDSKNPYNLIDFKNNDFINPKLVLKKNNKRV